MKGSRRCIRCVLVAVVAAGAAVAQSAAGHTDVPAQAGADAVLRACNRATLHPGDPLSLRGDPRAVAAVGAATDADGGPAAALVDPVALRERALAMYDRRASFHEPLPRVGDTPSEGERARSVAGRGGAPAPQAPATTWLPVSAAAAVLIGALFLLRRREAARAGNVAPRP
ncbi:MAG: hypothetical protein HZA53_01835 [Planctomycetes bacterium]|nr:hypothetical protein [Planctomycetota bacterium]